MSAHGFVMYDITGRYAGCRVIKVPERDLQPDVDAMLAAVGPRTRLLFLANPNNPTGSMLPAAEVARLRAGLKEDVLLVLDSAYAEYVTRPDYDPGTALVEAGTNTVMTRTFSKVFGLGGDVGRAQRCMAREALRRAARPRHHRAPERGQFHPGRFRHG